MYRICEAEVLAASQTVGELPLSERDRRDGYVLLSGADQVGRTLARHFAGRDDLVVLTIACDRLVDGTLRFERPVHAGDELFPHFYGRIPLAAVVEVDQMALDERGRHCLPAAIVHAAEDERDNLDPVAIRVAWDDRHALALIEYPKPARIEDEAGIYAWEALLERRLSGFVEEHGGKIPAVVGLDNLWVAPRVERRYAELADKVVSRWFCKVARWATHDCQRSFFARANGARSLPSEVFDSSEQALAFVLGRPVGEL